MKCKRCNIEMEEIPASITIKGKIVGDPDVIILRCPKCKVVHSIKKNDRNVYIV